MKLLIYPVDTIHISMGWCGRDVAPLLTHWSCVFLARAHRCVFGMRCLWRITLIGWIQISVGRFTGIYDQHFNFSWISGSINIVSGTGPRGRAPDIATCTAPGGHAARWWRLRCVRATSPTSFWRSGDVIVASLLRCVSVGRCWLTRHWHCRSDVGPALARSTFRFGTNSIT